MVQFSAKLNTPNIVAIDNEPMDSGKGMGLMVPANLVLEQIYEKTGKNGS
jgi:hypothetical protein